jgi:hypothetical protein
MAFNYPFQHAFRLEREIVEEMPMECIAGVASSRNFRGQLGLYIYDEKSYDTEASSFCSFLI